MNNVHFEGISENMSYLFTNKGVTKISLELNDLNGKNYVPYTYENLNVAIDILKENIDFRYKTGIINLQEYTSHPRKFLNTLFEIFKPKNQISLINEWEIRFGSNLLLINESVDDLIIESKINESWTSFKILLEQWYNPVDWGKSVAKGAQNVYDYGKEKTSQLKQWGQEQSKQIKDKGVVDWAKDKASAVWKSVKEGITKAWNCVKANPVECIMEGMRRLVYTAAGTAVLTGVSFIPVVGQITNGIIFGSLLIWDIYKALSGKYESGEYQWSYLDIIVDAIAILLPAASKILKTAAVGVRSFAQFGKMAATKGGWFLKAFNAIKLGMTKLVSAISNSAKFIGDKLGIKWLSNFAGKATSKLQSWVDEMVAAGGKTAPKVTQQSVKSLNSTQKAAYDKLLASWKVQQKALGKPNLNPGQATRNKLIKQAKTFNQQTKQIWGKGVPKPIPPKGVILKSMGKSFLVTTALCSALGLEGTTCREKIESGEVTPEQIAAAEKEIQQNLSQSIEDQGGFDDLEFEL
jgi:hypothetical protein